MRKLVILLAALVGMACVPTYAPSTNPEQPPPSAAPSASNWPSANTCMEGTKVLCALNPQVTQATISTTICKTGWTATVRPPVSYTDPLKVKQMQTIGLTPPASNYEEDHRLPLELGGNPTSEWNLSPEAHPTSSSKDQDENTYKEQVCKGQTTLVVAQTQFIAKWLNAWPGYKIT